MRALCGLNVIPHWLNTSSTLAVQKIFNGNKYITPKYKYKYKYFTYKYKYKYKYKYSKNVLKYKYKYQVPHLWEFRLPKLTFHSDLRRRAASSLALPCTSSCICF